MAACFSCRQGTVDKNGVRAYKWMKKGLQANYYYSTADALQLPVELDQVSCRLQRKRFAPVTVRVQCAALLQWMDGLLAALVTQTR